MAVTLNGTQLEDVLEALDDAAEYRWTRDVDCARCGPVMCPDHKAGVQRAIRYASLALQLQKAAGQ